MPQPTPMQTAIQELITDGKKAKKTIGRLVLTYHPPTADKPAILAYGKLGQMPTTAETKAVKDALFRLSHNAIKAHHAQREGAYWVARYRLPDVAQQPLISEVQP